MASAQRISLVGAGYIAHEHAKAIPLLGDPGAVELSVADPVPVARERFSAAFLAARVVADAAALLAEPARPDDIVIVATPPFTHHDLTLTALRSGRHVLCEKPLAMTVAEAEEMVAVARSADRVLACCSSRFLGVPATARVRELVAGGGLGTLVHASWVHRAQRFRTGIDFMPGSTWFLDRSRSGGGVLMDWGCYDLTTLIDLFQPVRVDITAAWIGNPETALDLPPGTVFDVEEQAGASLVFHRAGGERVVVAYERSMASNAEPLSRIEIEGDAAAVRWDWLDWEGDGRVTVTRDARGSPIEHVEQAGQSAVGVHQRPLVSFVRHLRGEPSEALTGEDALFTFRCLRAIYDVAGTGEPRTITR